MLHLHNIRSKFAEWLRKLQAKVFLIMVKPLFKKHVNEEAAMSYDSAKTPRALDVYPDMPEDLKALLIAAEKISCASFETINQSVGLIDHTSLSDGKAYMTGGETPEEIEALCEAAMDGTHKAAAVCVYPNQVPVAVKALAGSGVEIATVNSFPHGDATAEEAAAQAEEAIASGATEIDTVIDYETCFGLNLDQPRAKLDAVSKVCRDQDVALKIILKASVYSTYQNLYDLVEMACGCCRDGDFIKTCTGKMPKDGFSEGVDASTLPMGLTVMKAVADYNQKHGTNIGVKISGGVKTSVDCERYKYLVAHTMGEECFTGESFRFGASSLLANLRDDLEYERGFDNVKAGVREPVCL
jgi:deoxyribose-phosphate aldolase